MAISVIALRGRGNMCREIVRKQYDLMKIEEGREAEETETKQITGQDFHAV